MPAVLPGAGAAQPAGMHFTHHDWEIACDNTRTCRAAGYHSDGGDEDAAAGGERLPVSVLLTRKAGPHAPIDGELQIGNPGEEQMVEEWPRRLSLTLRIDGKPAGTVAVDQGKWTVPLPPRQTALLVSALTRKSHIAWSDGQRSWKLSDAGAAAVLLKMDEFQGRLGTPGAIMRKGPRDENTVLPALPVPTIQAAAVPPGEPIALPKASLKTLRTALMSSTKECSAFEPGEPPGEVTVYRLSATRLLASMTCWRAAYNEGEAYWVVNATPPYAPEMVTTSAWDYADGKISGSHKGRGLADCLSFREWVWDGRRFAPTSEGTTGQCKSIAPGGPWSLPVLVTDVPPAARP